MRRRYCIKLNSWAVRHGSELKKQGQKSDTERLTVGSWRLAGCTGLSQKQSLEERQEERRP